MEYEKRDIQIVSVSFEKPRVLIKTWCWVKIEEYVVKISIALCDLLLAPIHWIYKCTFPAFRAVKCKM